MRAQGPGPARLLCLGSEHSASGSGAGRGSGQSRGRGGPRGGAAKTPSPAPQAQGQRALSPGRKRSLGSGGAHKVTRRTRAVAADTLARCLTRGKSSCKRLFHASGHMRVHTPHASRGVTRGGSVCPGPPRGSPRLPAPSKEWTLSDEPTTGVRVKRDSQGAQVGCDSSGHPHTPSATAPRLGGRRRLMDRRAARSWSGGAYAPPHCLPATAPEAEGEPQERGGNPQGPARPLLLTNRGPLLWSLTCAPPVPGFRGAGRGVALWPAGAHMLHRAPSPGSTCPE